MENVHCSRNKFPGVCEFVSSCMCVCITGSWGCGVLSDPAHYTMPGCTSPCQIMLLNGQGRRGGAIEATCHLKRSRLTAEVIVAGWLQNSTRMETARSMQVNSRGHSGFTATRQLQDTGQMNYKIQANTKK